MFCRNLEKLFFQSFLKRCLWSTWQSVKQYMHWYCLVVLIYDTCNVSGISNAVFSCGVNRTSVGCIIVKTKIVYFRFCVRNVCGCACICLTRYCIFSFCCFSWSWFYENAASVKTRCSEMVFTNCRRTVIRWALPFNFSLQDLSIEH